MKDRKKRSKDGPREWLLSEPLRTPKKSQYVLCDGATSPGKEINDKWKQVESTPITIDAVWMMKMPANQLC